jgi:hypothetical protein
MDRKQIIRTVIDKITVAVAGNSELVDVTITWAGGHDTAGQAFRPVARLGQLSYYPGSSPSSPNSPPPANPALRSPGHSTTRGCARPNAPIGSAPDRSSLSPAASDCGCGIREAPAPR